MAKGPKPSTAPAAAALLPPPTGDAEFDAMFASGLIDADDLLTKKQRRAQQLKKGPKGKKPASGGTAAASGGRDYWGQLGGWKSFDGDDMLLGAEEGGFAGLEILTDPSLIDPSMLPPSHGQLCVTGFNTFLLVVQ